jgi:hypothetical protein
MTEKIVLKVSEDFAEDIEAEYAERQNDAVESLEQHGWADQAERLENADIAENTAEKALFVLRQEVGE